MLVGEHMQREHIAPADRFCQWEQFRVQVFRSIFRREVHFVFFYNMSYEFFKTPSFLFVLNIKRARLISERMLTEK